MERVLETIKLVTTDDLSHSMGRIRHYLDKGIKIDVKVTGTKMIIRKQKKKGKV